MKKKFNFSQMVLISDNGFHPLLSHYMSYEELTNVFFNHLQSYTLSLSVHLSLAEPFLTSDFQEPVQSSVVWLDDIPLGEFFLFHHSVPTFRSLVYSSSRLRTETVLLHEPIFLTMTVPQYVSLIRTFTSRLMAERNNHLPSSH